VETVADDAERELGSYFLLCLSGWKVLNNFSGIPLHGRQRNK